ncbi:DNA topoisomerase III [Alkalibaculum sp. M08DMB]|uniref:DNA topoisomerase 3 n=1 Tax=Alkalibaculum sporogenes TaxID=2655001 RepID=A0A6A7KAV4_9FIRM|nr:DNA topoisomerase III [Alkalibaculum sporogenes]MPW26650.1 DNA topoisomerase III [Alkalibaculum sporogenes]
MSKKLIIAEKPSVARDIARVIKCTKKGDGIIEGSDYIITWALGHLVELAPPENYDEKYKSWNMIDLPIIPSQLKLEVIKKTTKQYHTVKKQLNRNDVSEIVIATDAGREGELVARWILEKAHNKKPIKRLWISSVTDKAIQEGFKQLKDGKNYDNLYSSALARATSDWIVGINATRALTCKYNAQLSCGRVHTPTLNLIADRENEIKYFTPKVYKELKLVANGISFLWKDQKTSESRIFNENSIQTLVEKCKKSTQAKVVLVDKKEKSLYPPQLYDLTELQRDANRLFDFSAKETLSIAQRLYENHKILTYPRTDSKYISSDIVGTLKDRLAAINSGEYQHLVKKIRTIKSQKHFVDNSKVSDHHALIPTEQKVSIGILSDSERKIFDLVVKRFLSVLYPPYKYEQTTIKVEVSKEIFTASGKHPIDLGWKEIYLRDNAHDENMEVLIPNLKNDQFLNINELNAVEGKTSPPSLFNEGTLLSAMENPSKYMSKKDNKLAKILGESSGLGTVATRADIIEKLFNKFYVEKRGKDIITTSKGRQLLELVPEDLKAPDLTATWEQKLDAIKTGKLKKDSFIDEIKVYTKEIIEEIQTDDGKFVHDNISGEKCSKCGKHMLQEKDKVGLVLVCVDRECGNRKRLSKVTNARCPNCKKKLTMVGEGEGQIFTCTCGHREKLSSFNQRKSKENKSISKKEAQKYLKKNNDESEVNSALADALSKLKL